MVNERWVQNLLVSSLNLQKGERLVIMTDVPLESQGGTVCRAALDMGAADALQVVLPDTGALFALVPSHLVQGVQQADVVIAMRSDLDLSREDAHLRAAMATFRAAGRGRWASLAQISPEVLAHELSADLRPVAAEAKRLAAQLRAGSALRLTSPAGTDLRLRYGGRPIHVEDGRIRKRGQVGNLPGGEVYVAPLETSAEGRLVVDLCLGDLELDEPVTLTFAGGRVVGLEGGEAVEELRERLADDPWAWTIGEFGLGANPHIRLSGLVALDEKRLGTAHVALGANTAFGGENPAETHYDCVISEAQVEIS